MKKNRQYRSNQGRSPEKTQTNEILMIISVMGIILIVLLGFLSNECYV